MRSNDPPNIRQRRPAMIFRTWVESLEEVRNAKTRRMRMRLVAPDGRRGEAGDRGPAARQAGPQHGGRDQRPGARPGQTGVIHQTLARPGVERRACKYKERK